MSDERGDFRLSLRDWQLIALNCLVLSLFYLRFHYLTDPDDTLRMLQVRAWLDGQSWFDLRQYRILGLQDVPMHWSRLVDIPLAGVILAARLFTSPANAEHVAQVVVPLLTLSCVIGLIYRATYRLSADRLAAALSPLLGCMAFTVFVQLNPGRIDHHGWQIVCALVALNGMLGSQVKACAWTMGAALATWLAISIEGLPLAAAFLAVLGLRWLRDPAERDWLVHASASLAITSAALWLATHRLDAAAMTPWCDAITPIHLAMFAWTAIGVAALSRVPTLDWLGYGLALGAISAVAGAILIAGQPQCIGGAFSQIDPYVTLFWLDSVKESQPIWEKSWTTGLIAAGPAVLGLLALAVPTWRAKGSEATVLHCYFLLLIGATALGFALLRACGVACALAAPPVAWQVRLLLGHLSFRRNLASSVAISAGVGVALLPWTMHILVAIGISQAPPAPSDCAIPRSKGALDGIPPSDFLVPLDLGPRLLADSHHRILASGHHRARAAMREEIDAFIGTADQAHAIIERRDIEYIAVCFASDEARRYREFAPTGFMAQLYKGQFPAWLQPVDVPVGKASRVWRVVK